MKKYILVVFLTMSMSIHAQEKITEGVVILKQTMSSSDEQMNSQLAMMGDMVTTTYFKGEKSRSELKNQMIGEAITIIDNDKKEMLLMLNNPMMGKKYLTKGIELSKEDLDNVTVKENDEVKIVLGYTCKRYDVSLTKEGITVEMVLFTTDKIKIITKNNAELGDKVSGFPLVMEMKTNNMGAEISIVIEATEVKSEKVDDAKFDMTAPEGYEKTDKLPGM